MAFLEKIEKRGSNLCFFDIPLKKRRWRARGKNKKIKKGENFSKTGDKMKKICYNRGVKVGKCCSPKSYRRERKNNYGKGSYFW